VFKFEASAASSVQSKNQFFLTSAASQTFRSVCSNLKQVLPLQGNLRTKSELVHHSSAQVCSLNQVLPFRTIIEPYFSHLRFFATQVLPLQDNLKIKFSHLSWFTTLPLQCVPTRGGSKDLQFQEKWFSKFPINRELSG
jgi:hypothetical protein